MMGMSGGTGTITYDGSLLHREQIQAGDIARDYCQRNAFSVERSGPFTRYGLESGNVDFAQGVVLASSAERALIQVGRGVLEDCRV